MKPFGTRILLNCSLNIRDIVPGVLADPRLLNGLALSGQFGFCKGARAFKWFRWIDFRSGASELPAIARRTSRAIAHATDATARSGADDL